MKVVSVFDSKSESWMQPIFVLAAGQAVRSFSDAVNAGDSDIQKHPEDFTLYLLGEWDPSTGKLEPLKQPVALVSGVQARKEIGG